MSDTVIVSGGNIQDDFALDFLRKRIKETGRENLRLIAADRGLEFFWKNGITPDIAVGDFDSLSHEGKEYLGQAAVREIRQLKPEKDDSDTQSAVTLAMEKGARDIVILGALGSRLDHMLANLGLLSLGRQQGVRVALVDCRNYVTLIDSGTELSRRGQFGSYVSFFPVGGDVKGLTLEGFKYSLKNHCLTVADSGLTLSNEIQEETARVFFQEGTLLMIMSRD